MKIGYRRWTREDLPAVRDLLWETWKDAYAAIIPPDDMRAYFDEHYSDEQMAALFADPNVVGTIAEVDGVIGGYAKTYYHAAEQRLYVHQLYILPRCQGLGLGKQLMRLAGERARTFGFDRVWLGVMVENLPALTWYQRMGYQVTEQAPFVMGKTTVQHYIGYVPLADLDRPSISSEKHSS